MKLIDLSLPMPSRQEGKETVVSRILKIGPAGRAYHALVYDFAFGSMAGTYIDLPGHITETADGSDSLNFPPEKLFRVKAAVIRLDKKDGDGPVSSEELEAACGRSKAAPALVINALGRKRFDEIGERSVYLAQDAVSWIIARGVRLLVSDIYESKAIEGVFYRLFAAGTATVCHPVNLQRLKSGPSRITVFFLPFAGATQIPCRIVAEIED
jgi:kynurenine formamidase